MEEGKSEADERGGEGCREMEKALDGIKKKGEEESGWPEKKINSDVEKTNS